MNLNKINEKAWKLAEAATIKERGRNKSFSNSRIRKMLGSLTENDFESTIKKLIEDYQPQDIKNRKNMKQKCKEFGNKLINETRDMGHKEKLMLSQYTQWTLAILEGFRNEEEKIRCLRCEGVNNEELVKTIIKK